MAFGSRYYNEFTSRHYKRLVRVEIFERDYLGVSEQIKMGASLHLSDSGDGREEPIKKLTASLRLLSTSNFKFEHLFTSDDRKYKVVITRNGINVFTGFLASDSYSEPYYSWKNYTVNLTARDNLGGLVDIPYLDGLGDRITGLETASLIVARTLINTGLTTASILEKVGIWSSDMNPAINPLLQSYINNDAFWDYEKNEPADCLQVLTDVIAGFGSQLRFIDGVWHIVDQAKFYNQPTVQGNSASFPSYLADKLNFPLVEKAFRWINRDAEMTILPAWKEFTLDQNYNKNNSLLVFPNTESELELPQTIWLTELTNWTNSEGSVSNAYSPSDRSWISFPHLDIPGQADAIPYYMEYIIDVESTVDPLTIKMDIISVFRQFDGASNNNKEQPLSDMDLNYDLISTDGINSSILTSSGWVAYIAQEKQLSFNSVPPGEITIIADGIPYTGDLKFRIWAGDGQTANNGDIKYKTIEFELQDDVFLSGLELMGDVNQNNNLSDEFEINIGQVPNIPNGNTIFNGGLFTSAGVAQEDWKRDGDTTAENLLKKIAIGYDLQNKQPARQVNGTVIWDHDLWTNIDDQNKRLMINSADWNMNTDEMSAEWVEVFEYKNTLGAFDLGYDEGFDNQTAEDYQTNTIFTLTEKTE